MFEDLDLPEISGINFRSMSHREIAALLPGYGGSHPMKGILVDKATGKAYGIASGWAIAEIQFQGMKFKSGAISAGAAELAGGAWKDLFFHLEAVAAAFMRTKGIAKAALYINGRNPCWGTPVGTGCYFKLPEMLAEGSQLTVYNKYGADFLPSEPTRTFHFTGQTD